MRRLSISRAWDESKAILSRDGRLFVSVSLALIALPALVVGLLSPAATGTSSGSVWASVLEIFAYLVAIAGQLALVRLALGPSITVGGAIGHGVRRAPIYFLSVCILVAVLFVAAIPFAAVLYATGVPFDARGNVPMSTPVALAILLYLVLLTFVFVRVSMGTAIASAEPANPLEILTRSWRLTNGNFWRLLLFLVLFFVAGSLVTLGLVAAVGVLVRLAVGTIEPMSVAAIVLTLIRAFLNAAMVTVLMVMLARIYVQLSGAGEADSGVPITGS